MNNIASVPPQPPEHGPHTVEGLLARSDGRIGKRYDEFGNQVEELRAEVEGARGALESAMSAVTNATAFRYRQEERARENPAHDLSADVEAAIEAERRAKSLKEKQSDKLSAIIAHQQPAAEMFDAMTRLLASHKTKAEIQFDPSEMYSTDAADPLAERATRLALLGEKVRERSQVENSYQPAEAVERALLGQLDRKAAAAEIAVDVRPPVFELPKMTVWAQPARDRGGAVPRIPDLESLACRHWHDELAAEIRTKVAEAYQGVPAEMVLDADERRKRLRALDAEIDKLQREVADLTWMLVEDGHDCDFPADIPARAILGIA